MNPRFTLALAAGALAAGALAVSAPARPGLAAQEREPPLPASDVRDPSGHPFRTPAGSAVDPVHRAAIARVSRESRSRTVALAELGDRLPFWIRRRPDGRFELAGAVAAGAASRFDLETVQNEFVEVHFRVAFQLRARYRGVAARAELYHVSSHLGDEFLLTSGREPIPTSREGAELLLQAPLAPGLVVYGGPGLVLRSTLPFERATVRVGLDWSGRGDGARPYASAEAFFWDELAWDPIIALEAGLGLGKRARLGVMLGTGPSRAEQFFRETETIYGLAFSFRR